MTAARKASQRWSSPRDRKCQALVSYARLSVKRQGGQIVELVSERVERQQEHNRSRAERDGHVIAFEVKDDGKSAWDPEVTRDGWEQALNLIRSGQADGILAWSTDRLVRQPIDAIHLMNAAKEAGIPVLVGTGSKVYDFTDSTDEFMFLVESGLGKKSSDDTQRRVVDKLATNREAGKLHGKMPYGFRQDPANPSGPRIVNPEHAEVIREVARRVLDGESWKAIVDDLEARGIRTLAQGTKVKGRPFTRTALRLVLLAPRVAGLIEHNGEIVGPIRDVDGKPQAPILDRETWDRVCSELRGRALGAPRSKRNLLTGVMVCGVCGGRLSCSVKVSNHRLDRRIYQCRGDAENTGRDGMTGCGVAITASYAEEVVRDAVIAWQANPTRLAQITQANAVVDGKVAALRTQLDRLLAISVRNADKFDNGIWDEETYARFDAPNDVRIKELRAELRALSQPSVLRDLALDTLSTSWEDATDDERRAMVSVALRSVRLLPAPQERGKGYDPRARVVCEPR